MVLVALLIYYFYKIYQHYISCFIWPEPKNKKLRCCIKLYDTLYCKGCYTQNTVQRHNNITLQLYVHFFITLPHFPILSLNDLKHAFKVMNFCYWIVLFVWNNVSIRQCRITYEGHSRSRISVSRWSNCTAKIYIQPFWQNIQTWRRDKLPQHVPHYIA